jgi:hypothetical protein
MGLLKIRLYYMSLNKSRVNVMVKGLVSMHIERFSRFGIHYTTSVVMTTKPETKSAKTVTQMMVTVAPPTAPLKT